MSDLSKAVELNPLNANFHVCRGWVYYELKEYSKSLLDFNKAIEINPDLETIYDFRGATYIGLKDYSKAMDDFNKAIEIKPDYDSAYRSRGIYYLQIAKEYSKALDEFNKALEVNPEFDEGYYLRGKVYMSMYNFEKAEVDFRIAYSLGVSKASKALDIIETVKSMTPNSRKLLLDSLSLRETINNSKPYTKN